MELTPAQMAQGTLAASQLEAWLATGSAPAGVSKATLYRWRGQALGRPRHEWPTRLAPRYTGRTAEAEIPGPAWEYFCGLYLQLLAPAATECYRRTQDAARRQGWGEVPSKDTFMRRLKERYSEPEIILAREGQEALFRLYPAQQRSVLGLQPLQWINADGLQLDLFCRYEDGTIGRPHLWTWQDVYSRLPLAWVMDQTENTCQIRRAFGQMLEKYGLYCGPDGPHAVIDNTRAAANKTMTGGTPHRHRFAFAQGEAKGILTQFGYTLHWTSVDAWGGRGQAKPIERLHREMQEKICKSPECWGAYTGNNTTAKPEDYAARAVPEATLRAVIEREMERIADQQGRRTEVANGGSLRDAFQEAYAVAQAAGHIRQVAEHERRLFLLAQATRRASAQDGCLTMLGNRYWAEELTAWRGKDVVLRYDPDNLQQDSWAYTLEGELIGPVRYIASQGFGDVSAAREHERARRQYMQSTKAALKAKLKLDRTDLADLTDLPITREQIEDEDVAAALPETREAAEARKVDVWGLAGKAVDRIEGRRAAG